MANNAKMNVFEKMLNLENEVKNFGFKWENSSQIMEQIKSECTEIDVHLQDLNDISRDALQEEIGDLMHAVLSLCIFCQFDPQDTLYKSINKFEKRFTSVKNIAAAKGLKTLEGLSFNELMFIWNQAKIESQ